jgi:cellulose synthase/poly-beta-1,6-N-acetylglucosamine synthase-like glycosyltransferase
LKVSILLAVRNEEDNILRCLNALIAQDFPTTQMEVLIGNDYSEDRSRQLIADFIKDKPHFKLIDIQGNIGTAKGKGNVIAQLAQEAQGDYLLITDADVCVPPTWVRGMVGGFEQSENIGIVTGFTIVAQEHLIAKLDCMDWINNVGLMNVASMLKLPTNSMGNNMAVSRLAYLEMGGIEVQPFMICEDLVMFKAIIKRQWGFVHLHSPDILGVTKPQANFYELLQQRQRWLDGALKIPIYLLIPLLINGLFLFVLLPLLFWNVWIGMTVWATRFLFHTLTICYFAFKIQKIGILKFLALYELFITFFNPFVCLFYLFSQQMKWKGRGF